MARWSYPLLALIVSTAAACSQDDLQTVSIPECDDLNICTTDHWDQELFECVFDAVDDGTDDPLVSVLVVPARLLFLVLGLAAALLLLLALMLFFSSFFVDLPLLSLF